MRTAEIDAFGPWISEVTTPDEVPALYRDHPVDVASALRVLKIPRVIDRRDVVPGMDLYDHLLVVTADDLTVLSRTPGGTTRRVVAFRDVCAIEHGTDLLEGWLTLHDATSPVPLRVGYNGSSRGTVEDLVQLVRSRHLAARPDAVRWADIPAGLATPGSRDLGEADIALVGAVLSLLESEYGTRLLATHGRVPVVPLSAPARLVRLVRPMVLHAAAVCATERELLVVHRRHAVGRTSHPEHSLATTVVPLAQVESIAVRDDAREVDVRVVTIRCGEAAIEIRVPRGASTERALLDVSSARVDA